MRFFSTLSGFPRRGRMAWKRRSLPILAFPPALSPSTIKSSLRSGIFPVQAESLPTSGAESALLFSRSIFFAFFAASRTFAAVMAFSAMRVQMAVWFKSEKYSLNPSQTMLSTALRTSVLPRRVFVCPSNCTFLIFRDRTAVSPSRKSSPSKLIFSFAAAGKFFMYSFMTFVTAALKPVSCVPPSDVGILLT